MGPGQPPGSAAETLKATDASAPALAQRLSQDARRALAKKVVEEMARDLNTLLTTLATDKGFAQTFADAARRNDLATLNQSVKERFRLASYVESADVDPSGFIKIKIKRCKEETKPDGSVTKTCWEVVISL